MEGQSVKFFLLFAKTIRLCQKGEGNRRTRVMQVMNAKIFRAIVAVFAGAMLLSACLSEEERAKREFIEKVETTFENTPPHLVREVQATCDKWQRLNKTCDEEQVRQDQYECWLARGYPRLLHAYKYRTRQRPRDSATLLKLDHCLELRKWRLVIGRRERYQYLREAEIPDFEGRGGG